MSAIYDFRGQPGHIIEAGSLLRSRPLAPQAPPGPPLLLLLMLLLSTAAVTAAVATATAAAPPVIFWSSEASLPGTTVMAMGGGLADATVELEAAVGGAPVAPQVLSSWEGSIQFLLPAAGPTAAYRFRACAAGGATGSCSGWRTVNVPDIMWAVGDSSANATAVATSGGWLKVYGRSLGFTGGGACAASTVANPAPATLSVATLTPLGGGSRIQLPVSAASCYDATMAVPTTIAAGVYNLTLANQLSPLVGSVAVTILPPNPWPTKIFPVAASGSGSDVIAAVAAAGAAGGGQVTLSGGTYTMGATPLVIPSNVQIRGSSGSALRWNQTVKGNLISNAVRSDGSIDSSTRFFLRDLQIEVTAAQTNYVVDITGHGGTTLRNVEVSMPHTLVTASNVIHIHAASSYEVTNCNLTHYSTACKPGYPHASIFFFDIGTEAGLIANNTGYARCTSFVGYSASGVVLEDNAFFELPYTPGSQAGGNGFASFGNPRKSERVSYTRNVYRGQFNSNNSPDGSFPHEAFSSDGTGGAYAGFIHSADANSVSVPGTANGGYVGGAVAILNGKGRGQVSKIASVVNPPPPPTPPPGPFPIPQGWHLMSGHNGSTCLPSAKPNVLFQGETTPALCITKCVSIAACQYATIEFFPPTRPGGGYCTLFAHCASIGGWDSTPCTLPPPHINSCVPQNNITAHIATYKRPANLPGALPIYGKYVLEDAFVIEPDATSYATIIPYVGQTMVMGNEIYNSTTMQIYGCGFNVIFAGNTLKHMYVTEKCIGSSGLSIFGIDYQGGKQPNFHFELIDNTLDDTEGLRVIGGDSDNHTISMGHVVRGNTVLNKIDPPDPWLGPNETLNPNYQSARNMENAILIGPDRGTGKGPLRGNPRCFRDIIVESNAILVKRGNGSCPKNGLLVGAEHAVTRNNTCHVQ